MRDPVALFLAGQQAFSVRVAEIGTVEWDEPTPCSDWTVAQLLDHVIDEHRWTAPLLSGASLDAATTAVAALPTPDGDRDPVWQEAAASSASAWSADGAVGRMVHLGRGPTPARQYLHEMIFDLCVHSWDLGQATRTSHRLPADLVDAVYEMTLGWSETLGSAPALFAPPVPVPDDAPVLDRLIGLTGRDPSWTPPA